MCVCVCVCVCVCECVWVCVLVAQLHLTLCNPMDCSPPGSSVHGILQARILEWVAMPSSRGSSRPRDRIQVSSIAGRFFTTWATREASKCPDKKRYQRADSLSEGKPCEHTGERWLCTSQEEILTKNRLCGHFDLRFPASWTVRK